MTPGVNGHRIRAERIDAELPGALASYVGDRLRIEAHGRAARRRYEEFVDPMLNVE